jgi:hypothetical protein
MRTGLVCSCQLLGRQMRFLLETSTAKSVVSATIA